MTEHINVVSYLLGAIVFSVGFLSARLHASADSQRQEANTASWRIREILARREHVAPSELVGLLSILRGRGDSIAELIRWLNGGLLAAAVLVTFDFFRLVLAGEAHSTSSTFLIAVLVTSAMAVGVIGEADARHLRRSMRAELGQTTLGHVERIDASLRTDRLDDVGPEVDALTRLFPDWGLMFEVRALVALRRGHADQALSMVLDYLEGPADDVYLSSVVGCAAAIRQGDMDVALRVLDLVEARGGLSIDDVLMRSALQLRAGHLDIVLMDESLRRTGTGPDVAPVHKQRLALANLGSDDLGLLTSRSALDVRPAQLPALHGVIGDYQQWGSRSAAIPDHSELAGTTLGLMLELVQTRTLSEQLAHQYEIHAAAAEDGASVESIGVFLLIGGRPRNAVVVLERAVAKNPKSARVHWAHAVSCWFWGWEDKAAESLDRALALDPENLILAETSRRFSGQRLDRESEHFNEVLSRNRWTTVEVLQLALIGLDVRPTMPADASPRDRFAEVVLGMALDASMSAQRVSP